jgi:glycosyltransferase involved in cell wall biosynthesis
VKVVTASTYREGSIIAITSAASRLGVLDRFYTTYSTGRTDVIGRIPVFGPPIAKELRRRAFTSLESHRIRSAATIPELLHVAIRKLLMGRFETPSGLMYWVKRRFDTEVARALAVEPGDVIVGLWGSSFQTFRAAGPRCLKVLHYLNSRPSHHNRYLRELANLPENHREMVPARTTDLVEGEMELADLLLVPSEFVAAQMPEHRHKVCVLPYGVDAKAFGRAPGGAVARTANVLYIGQISYRKGILTLFEAARRLPRLTFNMIGPVVSPAILRDPPPNVKYLGKAVHEDIPLAMRSADMFVLPSLEDAYPLVTMEAMAAGSPVIVSANCGTSELISHGHDGFIFRAGDVSELAILIDTLASNPELRRTMAQRGQEKVLKSFTWEQYSDGVLDTITERQAAREIDAVNSEMAAG